MAGDRVARLQKAGRAQTTREQRRRHQSAQLLDRELRTLGSSYAFFVARLKSLGLETNPVRLANLAQNKRHELLQLVQLTMEEPTDQAAFRATRERKGKVEIEYAAQPKELRGKDFGTFVVQPVVQPKELRYKVFRTFVVQPKEQRGKGFEAKPVEVPIQELMTQVRALVVAMTEGDAVSVSEAAEILQAVRDSLPDYADPTHTLGPYFDTGGVRRRLGVTRQALGGRRRRNTLLAVEADDGTLLYPTWQFTKDFQVVNGLPVVLKELDKVVKDGFSKAVWLTTAQDELADLSAAEWLARGGDPERVRVVAEADVARLLV